MVNNATVKPSVIAPTGSNVLLLKENELEKIHVTKFVFEPEHSEKGSEYHCAAFKATSRAEVDRVYKKMKIKYPGSTHISCGYRFENPMGPYRQDGVDNEDIGIGRLILNALKKKETTQLGVFIVRYYGGVHLGKCCFKIAEQLMEKAISKWFQKLNQRKVRTRIDSQSSIATVTSNYDSQNEDQQEFPPIESAPSKP